MQGYMISMPQSKLRRSNSLYSDDDLVAEWRQTPLGPPTILADVCVPALTALLTAVFAGVPLGFLLHSILQGAGISLPLIQAIGGVGSFFLLAAWWVSLWRVEERSRIVEETRYTSPRSPVEDQRFQQVTIPVEESSRTRYGNALRRFNIDLPEGVEPTTFFNFCRQSLAQEDFSELTWCGSNGSFSRPAFGKLRSQMMRADVALLEWSNPASHAQGVKLTARGRRVFSRLADTPPLQEGNQGRNYA